LGGSQGGSVSVYKKYFLPNGKKAQSLEIESIQELAARLEMLESGEKFIVKHFRGRFSLVVLSGVMMKPGHMAEGDSKHLAELLHRALPESPKFPRRDEIQVNAESWSGLPMAEIKEVSTLGRLVAHGEEDVHGGGSDVRQGDDVVDSGGGTGVQETAVGPEESD